MREVDLRVTDVFGDVARIRDVGYGKHFNPIVVIVFLKLGTEARYSQ